MQVRKEYSKCFRHTYCCGGLPTESSHSSAKTSTTRTSARYSSGTQVDQHLYTVKDSVSATLRGAHPSVSCSDTLIMQLIYTTTWNLMFKHWHRSMYSADGKCSDPFGTFWLIWYLYWNEFSFSCPSIYSDKAATVFWILPIYCKFKIQFTQIFRLFVMTLI